MVKIIFVFLTSIIFILTASTSHAEEKNLSQEEKFFLIHLMINKIMYEGPLCESISDTDQIFTFEINQKLHSFKIKKGDERLLSWQQNEMILEEKTEINEVILVLDKYLEGTCDQYQKNVV
ncbi:MAG: hypothetical protein ACK4NC_06685 [Candidatus Gracilibacteria bacterium]